MKLKLVSCSHDTLLGHIDVPEHWRSWWEDRGQVTTVQNPRVRIPEAVADYPLAVPNIREIVVARAWHSQYADAAYLARGSIDDFEKLPGCSFSPSMAYLRSQMGNN